MRTAEGSVSARGRSGVSGAADDLRRSPAVAWQLFLGSLRVRHRRAGLRYLWLVLPTVAVAGLWVFVQSRRLVEIDDVGMRYPLFVLTGTALWLTFVEGISAPLQQLTASRQLVTRSRVPLEAVVLSGALDALLGAGVRLLLIAGVAAGYGELLRPSTLLVPLGVLALLLLGLTLGLLLAPAGLLYDDVPRIVQVVTGLGFFLTPVVYPTSGEGLLRLNPVSPLLETTRGWLVGGPTAVGALLLVVGLAVLGLFVGWFLLRVSRPHVVATLG